MVEFEARKKRAAAKAADDYVKRAKAKIIQDGTTLEKLLEDLDTEAFVLFRLYNLHQSSKSTSLLKK